MQLWRQKPTAIVCLIFATSALAASTASAAPPQVQLEVFMQPGINAATASQRWNKLLGELGIRNAQFRPTQPGDRIDLQTGADGAIHITAELDSHGGLLTPGGQFALSDSAKLKKWLGELQTNSVEAAGQPKLAFGFTRKQMMEARQSLAAPVNFSTKGMTAPKAIEQIQAGLNVKIAIDPVFQHALAHDDPLRDELQGVASGTALAAIARPAGGVLVPRFVGDTLELVLTAAKEEAEAWAIGWPPAEKDEGKIIPALFDFINVEIDNTPANEALAAIQGRLKVPFLYDHNSMTRERIDMAKKVKVPAGKTFYKKILDRVLFQVRLKCEVRLDDAGKPLLWITTLAQPTS